MLGINRILPPAEAATKTREAAEQAATLDDGLAEAHRSLGLLRCFFDWNWSGAERAYRRAIDLDRTSGLTHAQFAILLALLSRADEAITEVAEAKKLKSVPLLVGYWASVVFLMAREYERGVAECERVLELDPNFPLAMLIQSWTLSLLGRHEEALSVIHHAVKLSSRQMVYLAQLGWAYAAAGSRGQAQEVLDELAIRKRNQYVPPLWFGQIHAGLHDTDRALEYFQGAYEERCPLMIFLSANPAYDPLRPDPRFQDLLRRMNFPH